MLIGIVEVAPEVRMRSACPCGYTCEGHVACKKLALVCKLYNCCPPGRSSQDVQIWCCLLQLHQQTAIGHVCHEEASHGWGVA